MGVPGSRYVDAWHALPPRAFFEGYLKRAVYILFVLAVYATMDQNLIILLGGWYTLPEEAYRLHFLTFELEFEQFLQF